MIKDYTERPGNPLLPGQWWNENGIKMSDRIVYVSVRRNFSQTKTYKVREWSKEFYQLIEHNPKTYVFDEIIDLTETDSNKD